MSLRAPIPVWLDISFNHKKTEIYLYFNLMDSVLFMIKTKARYLETDSFERYLRRDPWWFILPTNSARFHRRRLWHQYYPHCIQVILNELFYLPSPNHKDLFSGNLILQRKPIFFYDLLTHR